MNLDELLSQIQNMRTALGCSAALRRLAQLQQQADEAPSPQHQLEIMATFCTELATSLEELQATITEHQQANTGLRQTNDHLELALMAVNGIIYDWEIEQRTLFRTQGLVEILGYRPEEAEPTLKWWTQRIHPDDRQRVRQHISNALANNSDFALEYRVRHKSDRYLYVWDKGLIIRNAAGKAVRVVGSTIDISERKQAEAALREQTQFLRNVIDTNPNLICVKDWESKFTLSNQALADLYGTTVEDIIGKTDADFNPDPTQVEQYLRDDRQVISTLQPKFIPEEAITSATGEIRWLQTIKKPLLSGDGQTCNHVLAVATDITDRIQAEEEAQRSAAEITQLFNMLPCFVWKFCPATNEFIYATEIMTELSGISREAFFQKHQIWDERVDSGQESQAALTIASEAISKGEPYRVNYLFHTLDKGSRWFEVLGKPAYEDGVLYYYGSTTDITECKQALEALRQSEALRHTVMKNAPVVLYALDREGNLTLSEGKGLRRLGFKPGQAVGQSVFELYHNRPDVLANIRRTLAGAEGTWIAEIDDVVHNNRTTPLRDENGQIIGLIGVATDITERRRVEKALEKLNAELENRVRERTESLEQLNEQLKVEIAERTKVEAALRQREQEFRALAENAPDVIERFDRELRHVYVNPAMELATGKSQTEFMGKTNRELGMPEPNLALWEGVLEKIFATGQEEQIEFRVNTPTGLKYYQTRLVPEFTVDGDSSTDGKPVFVLGISRDITDRIQALEALQESEERFRQLAENIHEVFWIISLDGPQMLYVSPAYEEIWGKSSASLYENPMSWLSTVHPDDRDCLLAILENLDGGDYDAEYRIVRPDGSIRWIRDRGFSINDAQGRPYRRAGIAKDITVHKQAEAETFKALLKERELGELKSRFVSMTSHEFRTPLTAIQSSLELLLRYRDRYSEERQLTHLHHIQTSVEHMTQILNDILVVGEAESGKFEFNPRPIDLVQFCRNLVEELQLSTKNKCAIAFTYQTNSTPTPQDSDQEETRQIDNLPCGFPLLDEKLLRRILGNLLSNAIKYSPTGSAVQFHLTCFDDTAIFQIQDQGIGIPAQDLAHLFEPFHRANNVGSIQGTGLGLAIVKQGVDLHGGEITVASVVGEGTTFTVTLPLSNSMPYLDD